MRRLVHLALVVAICWLQPAVAGTYSVTVEPSYPASQAENVYKPLLDYLSRTTGEQFVLSVAGNYHIHWNEMLAAKPIDFSFEDPQFTDYRIRHQGTIPLVRNIDPTRYRLIADRPVAQRGAAALVGYRVVSMPSPSLGYLLLNEVYSNPMLMPEVLSVGARWRDGVEMIFSEETEAAMLPGHVADMYPNLDVISTSRELPGVAFSASARVPAEVRRKVTAALLALHEDRSAYEVIVELGLNRFVTATPAEFAGLERLLQQAYGYKPAPAGMTIPETAVATATVAPVAKPAAEPRPAIVSETRR